MEVPSSSLKIQVHKYDGRQFCFVKMDKAGDSIGSIKRIFDALKGKVAFISRGIVFK